MKNFTAELIPDDYGLYARDTNRKSWSIKDDLSEEIDSQFFDFVLKISKNPKRLPFEIEAFAEDSRHAGLITPKIFKDLYQVPNLALMIYTDYLQDPQFRSQMENCKNMHTDFFKRFKQEVSPYIKFPIVLIKTEGFELTDIIGDFEVSRSCSNFSFASSEEYAEQLNRMLYGIHPICSEDVRSPIEELTDASFETKNSYSHRRMPVFIDSTESPELRSAVKILQEKFGHTVKEYEIKLPNSTSNGLLQRIKSL
jgi:hypothetical protein